MVTRQIEIGELEGVGVPFVQEDRSALTAPERQRLNVYEAAIESSFSAQTAGVLAAEQIHKERLWRADHDTFEDYCQRRWSISASQMYRRIQGARVVGNILADPREGLHNSEAEVADPRREPPNLEQALALSRLETPEEQREVWAEASTDEKPTAKKVQALVEERQGRNGSAPSIWSPAKKAEALALVAALDPESQPVAATLIEKAGFPADRAMLALCTLSQMPEIERKIAIRLYQSDDSRDRSRAIATLVRQNPPADPRRAVLETWLPEVERCAKLFPNDPITPQVAALADQAKSVIEAIRRLEQEKNSDTETN